MSELVFDIQVNGYGGVDFNQDELSVEELERSCEKLKADGVSGILATVITETMDSMVKRLGNLYRHCEKSRICSSVIKGIHIEGPFLNPTQGYRGAHPADAICPANVGLMARLLEAAGGMTRLVTLAPEMDENLDVTRMLVKNGVKVSAGHCDPSLRQLEEAIDAGLSLFTHLGNGCPMQMHRHDNIVQRVLSLSDKISVCFIADGVHVPFMALKNYLKITGLERTVVVTDSIAPAGLGPGRYKLGRWDLLIEEDMVARAPDRSHFVGSAVTMKQTLENLMRGVGMRREETLKLISENPRKAVLGG